MGKGYRVSFRYLLTLSMMTILFSNTQDSHSATYNTSTKSYTWSDNTTLTSGAKVKADYITEIKAVIDEIRARCLLPAIDWTTTSVANVQIGEPIRASHMTDLKTAIKQIYTLKGVASAGVPSSGAVGALSNTVWLEGYGSQGSKILSSDLQDMRLALNEIAACGPPPPACVLGAEQIFGSSTNAECMLESTNRGNAGWGGACDASWTTGTIVPMPDSRLGAGGLGCFSGLCNGSIEYRLRACNAPAPSCIADNQVNDVNALLCPGPVCGTNVPRLADACCSKVARYTCNTCGTQQVVDFVGVCIPPTCTDGVLNQSETQVDCGGPCAACPPPVCSASFTKICTVDKTWCSADAVGPFRAWMASNYEAMGFSAAQYSTIITAFDTFESTVWNSPSFCQNSGSGSSTQAHTLGGTTLTITMGYVGNLDGTCTADLSGVFTGGACGAPPPPPPPPPSCTLGNGTAVPNIYGAFLDGAANGTCWSSWSNNVNGNDCRETHPDCFPADICTVGDIVQLGSGGVLSDCQVDVANINAPCGALTTGQQIVLPNPNMSSSLRECTTGITSSGTCQYFGRQCSGAAPPPPPTATCTMGPEEIYTGWSRNEDCLAQTCGLPACNPSYDTGMAISLPDPNVAPISIPPECGNLYMPGSCLIQTCGTGTSYSHRHCG